MLIALVLAVAAAAVALLATGSKKAGTTAPTTVPTSRATTTTLPPPPPLQAQAAAWKLPVAVRDASAVAGPGGKLLVIGGETAQGGSADGVFLVDQSSGALHQVAALPEGVRDAAAVALGDKVYVIGGSNGATLAAVQAFAPTQAVAPTTSGQAAAVGATTVPQAVSAAPLPGPRQGEGAVVIGTTAYVVGGAAASPASPAAGTTGKARAAGPADGPVLATTGFQSYRAVADLTLLVQDAAVSAGTNGDIYIFGGYNVSAAQPLADVQQVDPATGTASVVAQLPTGVRGAAAFTDGPYIYVAGGQGAKATNGAIWAFNPADDKVTEAGHLALPVAYAAAAQVGGQEWLVGGESGGRPVASAESING